MKRTRRHNFEAAPKSGLWGPAHRHPSGASLAGGMALMIVLLLATDLSGIRLLQTAQGQGFPPRLQSYLDTVVRMPARDRRVLLDGSPVSQLLDAEPGKEVAVFGAIWINAPRRLYAESVMDIENHERGGSFKITKRISNPPQLKDFAQLRLPAEDILDLKNCRVGACELKMSRESMDEMRSKVDWTKPGAKEAAEELARQLLLRYVTGYLESGNARLAVYRDKNRPTFVETEFKSLIERAPSIQTYLPQLQRYLLEYPKTTLPGSTDVLYWQEAQFGLKPTIRVSHLVVHEDENETVVASKMLYSSHYFWTALEIRVLLADPSRGPGFWFVTVSRSRSDGLDGFVGRLIRGRVEKEAQQGTLASLKATKTKLEREVR